MSLFFGKRFRVGVLYFLSALVVQCAWSVCLGASIWLDELDLSKVRQGWEQAGKGRSVGGGVLTIAGKAYERGVGTHAVSVFAIALHGSAAEFTAVAGLDDGAGGSAGSSRFKAYGDGRLLWQSGVVKADSSVEVLVDLADVNMLVLVVDDGGDGVASDHADWAVAKIDYEGKCPQSADPPGFGWYPAKEWAGDRLEIAVAEDNWSAPKADVQKLLDNVRDNFFSAFEDKPTGFVSVYKRGPSPMIVYRNMPDESFSIHLNTGNTFWAQYSYQFSHELCHLAMHYDRHRGEPHPFKWLHECICETASIYTMRVMSKTWRTDPPYSNWKSFSQSLAEYSQARLETRGTNLPEGQTLGQWYQANRDVLRYNDTIRALNSVVAHEILVLFEKDPAGWNAICYMPDADGTLREYLVKWHEATPLKFRQIILDIAREFGYSIQAALH